MPRLAVAAIWLVATVVSIYALSRSDGVDVTIIPTAEGVLCSTPASGTPGSNTSAMGALQQTADSSERSALPADSVHDQSLSHRGFVDVSPQGLAQGIQFVVGPLGSLKQLSVFGAEMGFDRSLSSGQRDERLGPKPRIALTAGGDSQKGVVAGNLSESFGQIAHGPENTSGDSVIDSVSWHPAVVAGGNYLGLFSSPRSHCKRIVPETVSPSKQPEATPTAKVPTSASARLTDAIAVELAGSPLAGEAAWLVGYAAQRGVFPVLVVGIVTWESSLGRQAAGNNVCGLRSGPGSYAVFASLHDGLAACVDNLATARYRGLSVDDTLALWLTGDAANRSEWATGYIARVKATMDGIAESPR